jgi:hypothetical protein
LLIPKAKVELIPTDFNQFLGYFSGLPATVTILLIVALSLALAFFGRDLIQVLAFIVTGLIVGVIGAQLGLQYLGTVGEVIGGVGGFFLGGLLGVLLVIVGIGIALGYLSYSVTYAVVGNEIIAIIAGGVLFIAGIILANQILSIATALLGGLILFDLMTYVGMGFVLSGIIAVAVAIAGAYVQTLDLFGTQSRTKKTTQTTKTITTNSNGSQTTTTTTQTTEDE